MFDRKKHAPPQKRIDCLIGAGTTVRGDIVFVGGLRIDGQVTGNVATDRLLNVMRRIVPSLMTVPSR